MRPDVLEIALDRFSQRRKDLDGRLHVDACNISKANVCPYMGREIPGWQSLGLDANRLYHLYREPAELARAAESFERLQLLERHQPVSAGAPARDLTVGTVSDVAFDSGYLRANLTVWAGDAIDRVESRDLAQISCGYRYRADMTPGTTPDGVAFDGVMRDIIGNHVALVRIGRAGPDVVVADELPEFLPMSFKRSRFMSALQSLVMLAAPSAKPEDVAPMLAAADEAIDEELLAAAATGPAPIAPAEPMSLDSAEFKSAVTAQVEAARADERAKGAALAAALTTVEPLVGEVKGMDSAEAVYRYALDKAGVEGSAELPAAALPAMVSLALKSKAAAPVVRRIAQDAAPVTLRELFPGAAAIRRL